MKMIVLSIRDRASDAFARPFFVPAIGAGVRSFVDEINRRSDDNPLNSHPEDYDLFELGTFDDNSGVLVSLDKPRQVAIGKDMVKPSDVAPLRSVN